MNLTVVLFCTDMDIIFGHQAQELYSLEMLMEVRRGEYTDDVLCIYHRHSPTHQRCIETKNEFFLSSHLSIILLYTNLVTYFDKLDVNQ